MGQNLGRFTSSNMGYFSTQDYQQQQPPQGARSELADYERRQMLLTEELRQVNERIQRLREDAGLQLANVPPTQGDRGVS